MKDHVEIPYIFRGDEENKSQQEPSENQQTCDISCVPDKIA